MSSTMTAVALLLIICGYSALVVVACFKGLFGPHYCKCTYPKYVAKRLRKCESFKCEGCGVYHYKHNPYHFKD